MEVKKIIVGENDTLEGISRIPIRKGDVILVEINHEDISPSHYREHAESVKKLFNDTFNDNKCIVVPKGRLSIAIISPEEAIDVKLRDQDAV